MAYTFHWSPGDIKALTSSDLDFWADRIEVIHKEMKKEASVGKTV